VGGGGGGGGGGGNNILLVESMHFTKKYFQIKRNSSIISIITTFHKILRYLAA
jgi:hypothetical protein